MVKFKFGKEYYEVPTFAINEDTGEEQQVGYTTIERDMIYEGDKAVKGPDYIRLYDAAGNEIASFASISDFSGYELLEGEWSEPDELPASVEERLAVVENMLNRVGSAVDTLVEDLAENTAIESSVLEERREAKALQREQLEPVELEPEGKTKA